MRKIYKGLPKSALATAIAVMLLSISVSMAFSISPQFMTMVLGMSMLQFGTIEGIAESLAQMTKLLSGLLADYFKKRKPALLTGFLLSALSKVFFVFATNTLFVVIPKFLERLSNGIISTPRDTYIADIAPKNSKGAYLGLMMSSKTIGCTIGSWSIALCFYLTDNYRILLAIGLIPALVSVLILYLYMEDIPEKKPDESLPPETIQEKPNEQISWGDLFYLKFEYWSLIWVASLFMMGRFSDGFLNHRIGELGGSPALCASVIGTFNLVSAIASIPFGYFSDTMNRSRILYLSLWALVASHLCLWMAGDVWLGMVGVIFWGIQRATSQIIILALIVDQVPRRILGVAMGLFYLLIGALSFLSSTVAGALGLDGLDDIFKFGMTMAALSIVSLTFRNFYIKRGYSFLSHRFAIYPISFAVLFIVIASLLGILEVSWETTLKAAAILAMGGWGMGYYFIHRLKKQYKLPLETVPSFSEKMA